MRYRILGGVTAAALGLAAIGAWALPASAQGARFQPALAGGAESSGLLALVRERGSSGGGGGERADRGGSGGGDRVVRMDRGGERFVDRDGDRRQFGSRSASRSGSARVTRLVRDRDGKRRRVVVHRFFDYPYRDRGGFALGYGAAAYAGYGGYCMSLFQAYDPGSGLYLGYDGLWYSCP
ncbi:MAG TPA: hypothetical protein VFK79_02600 [Xanthobacteraceae bacterium]|nr:hypothetical protein [Xanthobacteraceae bacterium]